MTQRLAEHDTPASELQTDAERCRMQLVQQLTILQQEDGLHSTAIPGLQLSKISTVTEKMPGVYKPTFCMILQGAKQIWIGDEELHYNSLNYLVAPMTMPVKGKVCEASTDKPFLGLSIEFDLKELTDMVIELGPQITAEPAAKARALHVGKTSLPLLSAIQRLIQLLDSPADTPVLLPLIRREIMYRLLQSELGNQLRQYALNDSQAQRIARVIELMHQRFDQPLRIRELADTVHMSESTLFQSFKAVTSMSPLQFQKKLRLNEARRIMLYEGVEAATASYKVGYESPSQFSREYSRLFGAPPKTDIARFRQSA